LRIGFAPQMKLDDKRLLERLQHEFGQVSGLLRKLTRQVMDEGITTHPVFVATRQPVNLGLPVVEGESLGLYFSFRVSPLEELKRRGILQPEALDDFLERHNNPRETACVLLLPTATTDARFVFIPFVTPTMN
jgi:hypothetical protein